MLENPGQPGSSITGERTDLEVAQCAALGLWSCSRSRKSKQVCCHDSINTIMVSCEGFTEN